MIPVVHEGDNSLRVTTEEGCLEIIRDFVRQRAEKVGMPSRETGRLVLAVDEASSNILKHSYQFESGHHISVSWTETPDRFMVELKDFNPIPQLPSHVDFDLATKLKYRQRSGYGRLLMQATVDEMHYASQPGVGNTISLVKYRETRERRASSEESLRNVIGRDRKRSLDLAALMDVGERLGRTKAAKDRVRLFLYSLMGETTSRPVVLMILAPGKGKYLLEGHLGFSSKVSLGSLELAHDGAVASLIKRLQRPILAREVKVPENGETAVLQRMECAVLVPLFLRGEMRGLVSLGEKRNKRPFVDEELRVAGFLGQHVLLDIDNEESRELAEGCNPHASVVWALSEIRSLVSHDIAFRFILSEPPQALVRLEEEKLGRILLTLLMHVVYRTEDQNPIRISYEQDEGELILWLEYEGEILQFDPKSDGYNPLIDRLVSKGLRLADCRREVEQAGGRIEVYGSKKVSVELSLPALENSIKESA